MPQLPMVAAGCEAATFDYFSCKNNHDHHNEKTPREEANASSDRTRLQS